MTEETELQTVLRWQISRHGLCMPPRQDNVHVARFLDLKNKFEAEGCTLEVGERGYWVDRVLQLGALDEVEKWWAEPKGISGHSYCIKTKSTK